MTPDSRPWATYSGANTLVTGGLGFIGSNLAIRLCKLGAKVTIVDSMLPEFGGNIFNIDPIKDHVTVDHSDLRDKRGLGALVSDKDYVFHLAGQVSHGDSMRDPELDLGVNCLASLNLVEACRHFNPDCKIIFTSTRQVYGRVEKVPVSETQAAHPIDVNGINKLAAEYYHLLYERTYDLKSVVLRLTNTYGPRQQIKNDRQGFIGIFVRLALLGQPIRIFGTGEQVRDFNYVDDVVEALLLAGIHEDCFGNIYNLGSPTHYSLIDFVQILGRLVDVKYEMVPFPNDKAIIDIGDFYANYSRFSVLTGWAPKIDLPQGLEKMVAFYREHGRYYL